MSSDELARLRDADLAELRHHWASAYRIWFQAGQFCAMRRDNGSVVRCGDADGLHREIRADYDARPVPR